MPNTASSNLQITVNGTLHLLQGLWLSDLVAELTLDPRSVAVELNRTIIPRSDYATTSLQAGDAVEIVRFIGGG